MTWRRFGSTPRRGLAVLCLAALLTALSQMPGLAPTTHASTGVTLTFWHYFTDRAALFQQFAKEYQQQTGVTVNMQLVSGDVLGQKFQAAAQAHTLPDLSAAWVGVGDAIAPYAKQGIIMNLSAPMKAGWATLGSAKFGDNALARACSEQLHVTK